MQSSSQLRPYLVLAAGVLAVSTASLFIRFAQNAGAPSLVIAAWRLTLAALLITPIVLSRYRDDLRALTPRQLGLACLGGVLIGIHFATWITSLEYTSVISSVVLVSTTPLWVAILTPFVLRERFGRLTAAGIILGMIGSAIVSVAGNAGTAPIRNAPMLGNGLALIGALAIAGHFLIGRQLRATVKLTPYIWINYTAASGVLIVLSIFTGKSVTGFPPITYLWMTLLALVPQLIGHTAYNYALGHLSAAYVSLTVLGEPVGSTILASVFLSEQPVLLQLFGGVLIMFALVAASWEEARRARRKNSPDS